MATLEAQSKSGGDYRHELVVPFLADQLSLPNLLLKSQVTQYNSADLRDNQLLSLGGFFQV